MFSKTSKYKKLFDKDFSVLIYSLFTGYLFILLVICFYKLSSLSTNVPNPISDIEKFKLYNQNGKTITEKILSNKITVVNFVYTRIQVNCSTIFDSMKKLYEEFKVAPKVQFISITVDPNFDTQHVLKSYSISRGISGNRWNFLTGDLEYIKKMSNDSFKIISDYFPSSHTKNLYLIDPQLKLRKFYNSTDPRSMKLLAKHIRILNNE